MELGTLTAVWRYPVKALRGESLRRSAVRADGLAGDRTAALVVTSPEHARAGRTYRGKEHGRLHLTADAETAASFAADAGVGVALDRANGRYFDLHPVSLIFDTWVGDVEALVGEALDVRRWRPNLAAQAAPAMTLREADLVGADLRIGTVGLHVLATIRRCITPTYDPDNGTPLPAVLDTVARRRANVLGVYCAVTAPGELACGDRIERA